MNATLAFCIFALTSSSAPPLFYCTAQECERVCLFQWLSVQCDRDVVRCASFHNSCLASVDVES
ncbi:hypothetical protein NP493_748g00024 [Ridgeia piscesae]|uniref:Secreted protein n=1 Tax=Ridgeia piscesae TaxID=27915 RepID=A0AAD9KPK6_RIDPI|nr:hypothetical protein NP493_748g00024 [Ridgeia piscesae]